MKPEAGEQSEIGTATSDSHSTLTHHTLPQSSHVQTADNGHENDTGTYTRDGINCFMVLGRKMKIMERENSQLHSDNQAMRNENEALRGELTTLKANQEPRCTPESHEILIKQLEEVENRLKTKTDEFDKERKVLIKSFEQMKLRAEESEEREGVNKRKIDELERSVQKFQNKFVSQSQWTAEGLAESDIVAELETRNQEISNDLRASEFQLAVIKGQMKTVNEKMISDQQKREQAEASVEELKSIIDQLEEQHREEQKHIVILEKETLEIDFLRSQLIRQSEKKVEVNVFSEFDQLAVPASSSEKVSEDKRSVDATCVQKYLQDLIVKMEEPCEGRRIEQLPESFQSEPPIEFQCSEIFYRVVELLKKVQTGQRVTKTHVKSFWDSFIKRAEVVQQVIETQRVEANRLACIHIDVFQTAHEKSISEMKAELSVSSKLALDRLSSLSVLQHQYDKLQTDIKARDQETISFCHHSKNQDNCSSEEELNTLFGSPKALGKQVPEAQKELKQKLMKVEEELVSERKEHQCTKRFLQNTVKSLTSTQRDLTAAWLDVAARKVVLSSVVSTVREAQKGEDRNELVERLAMIIGNPIVIESTTVPEDRKWLLFNYSIGTNRIQ